MNLTYKIEMHPKGVSVISLKGKILSEEAFDEVFDVVETKIQVGEKNFIVNLKDISHINSSGLNVLLRLFTRIRNKGGEMILIHPSKVVNQLFIISKLNTVFKIGADENDALKQLIAQEA
ncbi:MAG: STAS domain-containing protein [Brumimicrobium sp.]